MLLSTSSFSHLRFCICLSCTAVKFFSCSMRNGGGVEVVTSGPKALKVPALDQCCARSVDIISRMTVDCFRRALSHRLFLLRRRSSTGEVLRDYQMNLRISLWLCDERGVFIFFQRQFGMLMVWLVCTHGLESDETLHI